MIEHLMILANEQVARRLESARVADHVPRARAARPGRDRAPRGAAREPRGADSTRAEGHVARPTRRGSWARSAAQVMEYQRATGRGGRVLTSLVLRALKQAYYSPRQHRPRGAREPELLPLHLADPPLSRPGRPPRAAGDPGRRRGAAAGRPGRGRRPVQRDGARGGRARARGRRRLLRLPARARAGRAGLGAGVRGRGDRRDRGGRVRGVRPRRGRGGLRGVAAGAPHAGRLVRPQRGAHGAGRAQDAAARCGSATRSR